MLTPAQIYLASTAIRELRVSLSNTFLYASGNSMVGQSIDRFLRSLEGLFATLPSVTLGESEGRLVMEGTALDERTTGSTNMIKDLFLTHKLHSLTFLKGVEASEVKTLFELLRPKALPTGLSLSQALVQKSLAHLKANEKVFVAIQEGEKVVSASEAGGAVAEPGEENLQEALEALQYFLQIFSKVKPDNNKREIARRMLDNMGGWVKVGEGTSPAASEPTIKNWKEVMGGFRTLRESLGSVKQPTQLKGAQAGLEELMRKLVTLGESAGLVTETGGASGAGAGGEGVSPDQESLFETDQILAAVDNGKWEVFWDPALEEQAAECLSSLQAPEKARAFQDLWKALWNRVAPDDNLSGLVLRHMNRLRWAKLPRPLQLEGLRNLRAFLLQTRNPETYPVGLTLAQDWVPQETANPDWREFREMAQALKDLADNKDPLFDKQNLAAQVAVETIFCDPVLESLVGRWERTGEESDEIVKLFRSLGTVSSQYLFGSLEREEKESPRWGKIVDFMSALESSGIPLYEDWLSMEENRGKLDGFLDIFRKVPLSSGVADFFERYWNSFGTPVQLKILELVGQWQRADFRPFLVNLLASPDKPQALQALKALTHVALEGDAEAVTGAVERYPAHAKDKERFWIAACEALGEMADPASVGALREWADKYKFLEKKGERSLEVRKAAIEALGRFKSQEVRSFLEGLRKDAEKELLPTLERTLKPG